MEIIMITRKKTQNGRNVFNQRTMKFTVAGDTALGVGIESKEFPRSLWHKADP